MATSDDQWPQWPPVDNKSDATEDDQLTSPTRPETDAGRIASGRFPTPTSAVGAPDGGLQLVGDSAAPADLMATWTRRFAERRAQVQRQVEAFQTAGGICWSCRDTGYLRGDVELGSPCADCARGYTALAQMRTEWVAEQMRLAAVPARLVDWSFATHPAPHSQVAQMMRRFAVDWDVASGRGVLLKGDSSVGKSGLLVAALRLTLERWAEAFSDPRAHSGRAWAWFTIDVSLLEALRDGYADGTARDVLRRAKTCPLLIVDDLGKADYHEGQGWAAERLYEIVNARYSELRPTWFSTNLGSEQLEKRLGEMGAPIMERIMDACEALTVTGTKLRGGEAW